jgi:hypothetical protein
MPLNSTPEDFPQESLLKCVCVKLAFIGDFLESDQELRALSQQRNPKVIILCEKRVTNHSPFLPKQRYSKQTNRLSTLDQSPITSD